MIHTCRQSPKFKVFVRRLRPIASNPVVDVESVAVSILERLWHATTTGAKRGDIGRFDNELIAEECGWLGDADLLIAMLVDAGYLDEDDEHRLVVHDWHEHAPNHVKGVVARNGGFLRGDPGLATKVDDPGLATKVDDPGLATQCRLPPNLTKPNQTKPLVDSIDIDQKDLEGGETHTAEILRKLPAPSAADCDLAWKAGLLVATGRYSENWLHDAVAGTLAKRRKKPWAYFRTCLVNGAKSAKLDFEADARSLPSRPPPSRAAPPESTPRAPRSRTPAPAREFDDETAKHDLHQRLAELTAVATR